MKIVTTKKFDKHYSKLNLNQKTRVKEAIAKFRLNPLHPILRNHKLSGKLKNFRAISAANDLRILFYEKESYLIVTFISVGTHNQVY